LRLPSEQETSCRFPFATLPSPLLLPWSAMPPAAGADTGLLDAARSAQPAVVQSLKDMVSIESGSANIEGLDRMADYTSKRLQALGAR
jgi:hypothetical protein